MDAIVEVFEIDKIWSKNSGPSSQRVDNAFHWINHYRVDSVVCFANSIVPLDNDLSGG